MCPSHRLVGFTRVHRDLVVSDGKSGIYPDTVRRTLTRTVSSSRELPRLSRVLRLRTAPHASERDHLPWGCNGPSSRHQLAAISWWSPAPPPIRPRRFARPRRVSTPPAVWVCFAPQPRPGFLPTGVMPPAKPESTRRRPVPSRCWLRSAAAVGTERLRDRPISSAPLPGASPSGRCSLRESVIDEPAINRSGDPIPSWDSILLQVLRHCVVKSTTRADPCRS